MKHIIRVSNLSKQYRIGAQAAGYSTLRESLMRTVRQPFRSLRNGGRSSGGDNTIWALKDVELEIGAGEVVGIIGRNGSGKSTLLKILSRITEPTTGRVNLFGRVGSLLEVGTGFHHELTGRENIYLYGAILGMRREEIDRKFDEIVAFADVERFLNTAVKRYSSGMHMRLAFAVAAHLEPEILLIDEVLAVGDAQFQKKCLGKMGEVAKLGRTVLFVSHSMPAVGNLCHRVVWLDEGRVQKDGEATMVISSYLSHSFSSLAERVWSDIETAPGDDKVRLRSARVSPEGGTPGDPISIRTPFKMEFEFWNRKPGAQLSLGLFLYNEQGVIVFSTTPYADSVSYGKPLPEGLVRSICHVPGDLLNDGVHRVDLLIVQDQTVVLHKETDLLLFDVRDAVEMRGGWHGRWVGAVRPNLHWETEVLNHNYK